MFNRPMKHQQRYHLNRLADRLVTPERFGPTWWSEPTLILFDEMDSVHPAVTYVMALMTSDAVTCPYGNPDCPLPHWPMGHGKHRACNEDQLRRERAEFAPTIRDYIGREVQS